MKTRKMKYKKKTKNKIMQKGGLYFFKKRNRTWRIADQYGKPPMDVESYRNAEVIVLNRIAKNCNGNYRECIQNIKERLGELQNAINRFSDMDYHDYETYQEEYKEHIQPVLNNLSEVIKLRTKVNSLYADPDAHTDVVVELIALEKEIKKETEKLTEKYTLANKEEATVKAQRHIDKLQAETRTKQKVAEEAAEKLITEKVAAQEATVVRGEWPDDPELPEDIKVLNAKFNVFRKKIKTELIKLNDIQILKDKSITSPLSADEKIKVSKEKSHIDFLNGDGKTDGVLKTLSEYDDIYKEYSDSKNDMKIKNSEKYLMLIQRISDSVKASGFSL